MVPITIGGSHHSFRLRATPMRDSEGHLLGAVTLLEDVTALAELDKLKTEFISLASSKLREPLDSLRLGLHALTESRLGELNEEQTSMLEDARDNARDSTSFWVICSSLQRSNQARSSWRLSASGRSTLLAMRSSDPDSRPKASTLFSRTMSGPTCPG